MTVYQLILPIQWLQKKHQLLLLLIFFCCCFSLSIFAQTTPNFSINQTTGCVPLSGINFTDVSTGGVVTNRAWNLGNGTIIANGAAVVGTNYLTAQKFYVTLTATFSNGDIKVKKDSIIVHPRPIPNLKASDTAGCLPFTVNFTDLSTTASGTINNWTWDFGAGGSPSQNPSFVYNTVGNYNVSLLVKNSWGCESDSARFIQKYIRVYNKPNAAFTPTPTVSCKDTLTVFFNNNTTGGSAANTYKWYFGDGDSSSLKNPTHFYAAPGAYTVTLIAIVGNGCISTTTRTVNIGNVKAQFTAVPDTVCINTNTSFSGTATPSPWYVQWFFSDNNATQYYSPVNHVFTTPGDYQVKLIAFNFFGCSDTINTMVHVKAGAGLTPFFIIAPDTVCANASSLFDGSATPTPNRVQWFFSDNNALQNNAPTNHSFANVGDYNILLIAYDALGCADTTAKSIHVKTGPILSFSPDKVNGCGDPFTVTFTNTTFPNTDLQFTWNFGDGTSPVLVNDTLPITHSYTTFGNFTVTLTAVDTVAGCSSTPKVFNYIRNYQPAVNFTYVPPSGCLPLPVKFTGTVSNLIVPIQYYVWNYGDGAIDSVVSTNIANHTYTTPGNFNATLTIVTAECIFTSIAKPVDVIDLCDDDGSGILREQNL